MPVSTFYRSMHFYPFLNISCTVVVVVVVVVFVTGIRKSWLRRAGKGSGGASLACMFGSTLWCSSCCWCPSPSTRRKFEQCGSLLIAYRFLQFEAYSLQRKAPSLMFCGSSIRPSIVCLPPFFLTSCFVCGFQFLRFTDQL
jgi:hypothetical protein